MEPLSPEDLNENRTVYLELLERLKKELIPIEELDGFVPKYKEWAKNRKFRISLNMTCEELNEKFFNRLNFHANEIERDFVEKFSKFYNLVKNNE